MSPDEPMTVTDVQAYVYVSGEDEKTICVTYDLVTSTLASPLGAPNRVAQPLGGPETLPREAAIAEGRKKARELGCERLFVLTDTSLKGVPPVF